MNHIRQSIYQQFDLADLVLNYSNQARTAWGNLGYWRDTNCFVQANEALAGYLGQVARLNEKSSVLDLGFGCGEQLVYWLRQFSIAQLTGLNPAKAQFQYSQEKLIRELNSEQLPRVQTYLLPAERLSENNTVAGHQYDAILALDAAYHFHSRRQVFYLAQKVLAPGGRLAMTDMLPAPGKKSPYELSQRLPFWFHFVLSAGGVPRCNHKNIFEVQRDLEHAGFVYFQSEDISEFVFPGMIRFLTDFIEQQGKFHTRRTMMRYYATRFLLQKAWDTGGLRYYIYSAETARSFPATIA